MMMINKMMTGGVYCFNHSVHSAIKLLSHLCFTELEGGEKHALTFENSLLDHFVLLAVNLTK